MDDYFDEEELQEQPQQTESKSMSLDDVKRTYETGKKIYDKVKDSKGKEEAENGVKAAKKGIEVAEKGAKIANKTAEIAEKGVESAAKATKAGGKAINTASDAMVNVGTGASATGVGAVAGAPLAAAGAVGKAIGTGMEAAGSGMEAAEKGISTARKGTEAATKVAAKGADVSTKNLDAANKLKEHNTSTNPNFTKKSGDTAEEVKEDIKEDKKTVKKITDTVQEVVSTVTNPVKVAVVLGATFLLGLIIIFSAVFYPLFSAMDVIKSAADAQERVNNLMYGLGFNNSYEAFERELYFLDMHYDQSVNEPLLMSTLFYDDMMRNDDTLSKESEYLKDLNEEDKGVWGIIYYSIYDFIKESYTEEGSDGLVYSANKIFRLKKLTKQMMSKSGDTDVASLSDYVHLNTTNISSDKAMLTEEFIGLICKLLLKSILAANPIANPLAGNIFFDLTIGQEFLNNPYLQQAGINDVESFKNMISNIGLYFEDLFSMFTDIVGLNIVIEIKDGDEEIISTTFGIDLDDFKLDDYKLEIGSLPEDLSNISINFDCEVEYDVYSYDEEQYEEYLKETYIPTMPEFHSFVYDNEDNLLEDKVDEVYDNILMLADAWDSVYGDPTESSIRNNVCFGNIDTNLIDILNTPIRIDTMQEVNFSKKTSFGYDVNGRKHNGVDLTEESIGATVGTPVYPVYAGTVRASTASNDYNDEDRMGLGGWVRIEHTVRYINSEGNETETNFYSVYGGLDPTTVPATGTVVTTEQQIGVIGNATYSEDGITPGLHFGFIDIATSSYANPINFFITCSTYEEGGFCYYNSSGGIVMPLPDNIMEMSQMNYSATCYGPEGWYYSHDGGSTCSTTGSPIGNSNQKVVHKMWVAAGEKYTNGIATLRITNEDRYLVATTQYFGEAGDLINATLENGEVIHMVIGDIKSYGDTGGDNSICRKRNTTAVGCFGHSSPYGLSILEFEVDPIRYNQPDSNSPGTWGQEWDTSQKVVSITNYGSIIGNTSNIGEICDDKFDDPSNPSGPNDDNPYGPNPDIEDNANHILDNMRLDVFLEKVGSSIEEYNNEIMVAKNQAGGNCTRRGAVAIATKAISYMALKGKRLPYYWGGGQHESISNLKGAQGYWGDSGSGSGCGTYGGTHGNIWYPACGLDCAGFVRWILVTDGFQLNGFSVGSWGLNTNTYDDIFPGSTLVTLTNSAVLKPGDILFSSGHVMFVVGINSNSYEIAEASGLTEGIRYSTVRFNATGVNGIDMTGYYENGFYDTTGSICVR